MNLPRMTAIVVSYGDEPLLVPSVDAILASTGVDVDVILVDNGTTDGAVDLLRGRPRVRIIDPGANTGFAGGNNLGVANADAPIVALVNPDAIVEPVALSRLAAVAARTEVGIATASVRLASAPERLNSAGNEIHYLGMSWSGHFDEPAEDHLTPTVVLAASGACMAMQRERWIEFGGFCEEMFAYYEDADLSLRCRQAGYDVVYVPDAVVVHDYAFSKHRSKFFLAERNRSIMVLTLFGGRTLLLLAPALFALEVAVWTLAIAQGWAGAKWEATRWLITNRGWLGQRRSECQNRRTVSDRALASSFATRLDPGNFPLPGFLAPAQHLLVAYWAVVRRFV